MKTLLASGTKAYPSLFLNHGGGPMPLMKDPSHAKLIETWEGYRQALATRPPKAIVVVSAHYDCATAPNEVRVNAHPKPPMLYDYYGFPKETYSVSYPAPGEPALAQRVAELITKHTPKFRVEMDTERGFDHGVFIPLVALFPEATIPVVSVSLVGSEDALDHIRLGEALAALREEEIFILGSGAITHNMTTLQWDNASHSLVGARFNAQVLAAMKHDDPKERVEHILKYREFVGVEECLPQGISKRGGRRGEEHLMPFFAVLGTSQEKPIVAAHYKMLNWDEIDVAFA